MNIQALRILARDSVERGDMAAPWSTGKARRMAGRVPGGAGQPPPGAVRGYQPERLMRFSSPSSLASASGAFALPERTSCVAFQNALDTLL